MREFQERRRIKKFLHSRYAIAVLIVLCLLMAKGVWGVFDKYEKSKALSDRTKAELSNLETRQKFLVQSTEALATDQGKEREIRDRFGVVKEGEKMVVIVDNSPTSSIDGDGGPKSWWDIFVGFFTRD